MKQLRCLRVLPVAVMAGVLAWYLYPLDYTVTCDLQLANWNWVRGVPAKDRRFFESYVIGEVVDAAAESPQLQGLPAVPRTATAAWIRDRLTVQMTRWGRLRMSMSSDDPDGATCVLAFLSKAFEEQLLEAHQRQFKALIDEAYESYTSYRFPERGNPGFGPTEAGAALLDQLMMLSVESQYPPSPQVGFVYQHREATVASRVRRAATASITSLLLGVVMLMTPAIIFSSAGPFPSAGAQ